MLFGHYSENTVARSKLLGVLNLSFKALEFLVVTFYSIQY